MKKNIKAGTAILGGIMLLSALPVQAAGNNYTGIAGVLGFAVKEGRHYGK